MAIWPSHASYHQTAPCILLLSTDDYAIALTNDTGALAIAKFSKRGKGPACKTTSEKTSCGGGANGDTLSNGEASADCVLLGGIKPGSRHSLFSFGGSAPKGISEAGNSYKGGGTGATVQGPVEVDTTLMAELSLGRLKSLAAASLM